MSRPLSPLRAPLFAHIMAGRTPKEFVFEHAMSRPCVQKLLWAMGLKKHYLTDEEHAHILARRRAAAQQPRRFAA